MPRTFIYVLLTVVFSSFTLSIARAEIRLPKIFTDNMVLPAVCFRLELNAEVAQRLSLRDTSEAE